MHSEDYCSWVCLSVCLSVKSHLTSGASVRPENIVTYSAGNEGENIVGFSLKPLRCRNLALPALCGYPSLALRKNAHVLVYMLSWDHTFLLEALPCKASHSANVRAESLHFSAFHFRITPFSVYEQSHRCNRPFTCFTSCIDNTHSLSCPETICQENC